MAINIYAFATNILPSYNKFIKNQQVSITKLSKGEKILSAKENSSDMNRSENLRIKIKALNVAQRNIQDGISLLQSTDATLQEINGNLARMKELCIQSSNFGINFQDASIIQREMDEIKESINSLLKKGLNDKTLIGNSGVLDNDNPISEEVLIGSNSFNTIKIQSYNLEASKLTNPSKTYSIEAVDIVDKSKVSINIETIDNSIDIINKIRSNYGAIQVTLENIYENMNIKIINTEKIDSNLRDCDIAYEMMIYTKESILTQSSASMIAQTLNLSKEIYEVLRMYK